MVFISLEGSKEARHNHLAESREISIFLGQKTRFGETIRDVDLTALVFVVQRWFLYRWNDLKKQDTTTWPNLDITRSKSGSQYLGQEIKWSVVLITRSTVFLVNACIC